VAQPSNEEIAFRYIAAHKAHDYETVDALRHPDWTEEFPQTGERIRGAANDRAVMDNWPGGLPEALEVRVVGSEDRWVMTPAFTIERVVGSGDSWWFDGTADYPDGSHWFLAGLAELRDGRVFKETWYFAPPLEAPAWRARWVEPTG
jgi:hypothetical protein